MSQVADRHVGLQSGDGLVALEPGHRPTGEYVARLRDDLTRSFPGSTVYFQTADIVSQVLNFGLSAPVDVQVQDNDLARGYAIAARLAAAMRTVPGAADVHGPRYPAAHHDDAGAHARPDGRGGQLQHLGISALQCRGHLGRPHGL